MARLIVVLTLVLCLCFGVSIVRPHALPTVPAAWLQVLPFAWPVATPTPTLFLTSSHPPVIVTVSIIVVAPAVAPPETTRPTPTLFLTDQRGYPVNPTVAVPTPPEPATPTPTAAAEPWTPPPPWPFVTPTATGLPVLPDQ